MIVFLAAMTSFALIALGCGVLWVTLRGRGDAILRALAGEPRFVVAAPAPMLRRTVRFTAPSARPARLRAAA